MQLCVTCGRVMESSLIDMGEVSCFLCLKLLADLSYTFNDWEKGNDKHDGDADED